MTETLVHTEALDDDDWMPGGPMVGEHLDSQIETTLSTIQAELTAEGEPGFDDDPGWMRRQFGDQNLFDGLRAVEASGGVPMKEYVRHSHRFSMLSHDLDSVLNGRVAISSGDGNTRQNGQERRDEEGSVIDLDLVRTQGVDPSKVLYYRVTQPATPDNPLKPEYYWTSDSLEVRTGLGKELAGKDATAVVLVSTLDMIAENGGVMTDVNDDSGVAVRQIGLGPFSQQNTLFRFARTPGVEVPPLPQGVSSQHVETQQSPTPSAAPSDAGDDWVW